MKPSATALTVYRAPHVTTDDQPRWLSVLCIALIAAAYCLASRWDMEDQIAQANARTAEANERAESAVGFGRKLPRITFVLEARNEAELRARLAEIAGNADALRMTDFADTDKAGVR